MPSKILKWACVIVISILVGVWITLTIVYGDKAEEAGKTLPQAQVISDYQFGGKFAYDGKTKGPSWVLGYVDLDDHGQGAMLDKARPTPDQNIPSILRTEVSDYENSGFVIAPLTVASADGKYPLSVSSPQLPEFNKTYWTKLRSYVMTLPKKFGVYSVLVVTGPLYFPHEQADGEKYVTYKVIGKDNIAVPTHFFQAVFYPAKTSDKENEENWTVASEIYVIPNKDISSETPLESFKVDLEELERVSGVVFPADMKPYFIKKPAPFLFP